MMSKENVMEIVPIRDTKLNVANATVKAKELYDFVTTILVPIVIASV